MSLKAVVLAGTTPHIALLESLKRRGYETILVDFNPNCFARPYADRYINASTLDSEAVLNITKEEHADVCIAIVGDHINAVCAYVDEKLGLPHPLSYEKALIACQKHRMKPLFKQYRIPTADFYVLDEGEPEEIRLPFPLVVKPSDSNSSKGVFKVNDEKEFHEKLPISFSLSRVHKAIVEQYIAGTEIQVDCIAIDKKAHILMTKDYISRDCDGFELNPIGFVSPGAQSSRYISQIEEIAQKIVDAYGLNNLAFFFQGTCTENGVYVFEAAARMAGGSTFESASILSNTEYIENAIDCFLGNPQSFSMEKNEKFFEGRFLSMKPGIFSKLAAREELLAEGILKKCWMFLREGTEITSSHSSSNRIAVAMSEGNTAEEASEKMALALSRLAALDENGIDCSDWK